VEHRGTGAVELYERPCERAIERRCFCPPDSVIPFKIEARTERDSVVLVYPVRRDPRYLPGEARVGNVWIDSISLSPQGQSWLPSSEYLTFSARAAEGANVRVWLPGGTVVRLLPQKQPQEVLPAIRAFEHDTTKLRTPDEVRYVGVFRGRAIGPDPGPILWGPSASLVKVLARIALRCTTGGREHRGGKVAQCGFDGLLVAR